MPRKSDRVTEAVTEIVSVHEARAAVQIPGPAGPGSQDPLVGDLRKAGLLPLLVLRFAEREPCYGNKLIERISAMTEGALRVNPNTIYPLLRSLEARGLLEGSWEHPERRSRRFYRTTAAGREERERLAAELAPRLDRIARSIDAIREAVR